MRKEPVPRGDLEVHIDELVLEGFGPIQGQAVSDGVIDELERLLGERRVDPSTLHEQGTVSPGPPAISVTRGPLPSALGEVIGGAVYKGLDN